MRLREYYSRVVRDGRQGRPTMEEARVEYRRRLKRQIDAHLIR